MDWSSKVKKWGNIFNVINSVADAVMTVQNAIGANTEALVNIQVEVGSLSSSIEGVKSGLSNIERSFTSEYDAQGVEDEYGQPRIGNVNFVDILGVIAKGLQKNQGALSDLAGRLGNQFNNEVLAVLKQENAAQQIKIRELEASLEKTLEESVSLGSETEER